MAGSFLEVKNLSVQAFEAGRPKAILNSVSFEMAALSVTAIVGGSGSGKTTTGLSILRLLGPGLNTTSGQIFFEGKNLLDFPSEEMRRLRGGSISMVFQEPLDAFNPVFSIGYQIEEVLSVHTDLKGRARKERVHQLLEQVGLPDPKQQGKSYPHQLSGGMRQRAMIAQAIAANPKLIIADEPTSNLDVTLQVHIIELFKKLRRELNLSVLLITHDLGMVEHIADKIVVMTEGKVIEDGPTRTIIEKPKQDYTKQLLKAFAV